MPDETGKLTSAEKDKVIAWLAQKQKGALACPICNTTNWFVGDHLVLPVTLGGGGGVILGGLGYPQVMLVSQDCGYTRLLNAVMLGISPSSEEKKA